MYKSNLFSEEKIMPATNSNIWKTSKEQSSYADLFNIGSSKIVEDLLENKEDNMRQLEQEVEEFERSIINSDQQRVLIDRIVGSHDIYELAQRMTTRLRVLLSSNRQLAIERDAKLQRLEEEVVNWV